MAITIFHFLIYICLSLVGVLLDPTFMDLSDSSKGMAKILLRVWQISRNITNILLAFLLIIGGIVTVVSAGNEYVKKYATKFVVAVILVNFSWFFPRVILDISNILTATVYSIPSAIKQPCVAFNLKGEKDGKCKFITEFSFGKKQDGAEWECPIPIANTLCVKYTDLEPEANTPNAIIGGVIINYGRLRYLHRVTSKIDTGNDPAAGITSLDRLPELLTYLIQGTMVLFFSAMLLFPLMAMVGVFLVRIPVIWVTIAFMPFMFVGFVAGDLLQFNLWKEIFVRFLKAAFLPVVVAIPFAIGFIMLNSMVDSAPPEGAAEALAGMKTSGLIIPGVSNLWQLVWTAMAMLIIWYGAFKALKFDEDFNFIVQPLENAGKNVGKFVGQLPLLMPLPVSGVAGAGGQTKPSMSIKQMMMAASNPMQTFAPSGRLDPLDKIWDRMSGKQNVNVKASQQLNLEITNNNNIAYQNRLDQAIKDVNQNADPGSTNRLKQIVREVAKDWNGNAKDLQDVMAQLKQNVRGLTTLEPGKAKD